MSANSSGRRSGGAKAKLADLPQSLGKHVEATVALEPADRAQLDVRGATRPDEVRVVGVCEPVCLGARRADDRVLVERERGVAGTGQRESVGDRLGSLRVGDCVATPVVDVQLGTAHGRQPRNQLRPLAIGEAQLEMRRARPAQ